MTWDISIGWTIVIILLVVWEFMWKGFALWRASARGEKVWFTIMLFVGTVGVLPILYLVFTQNESHKTIGHAHPSNT